MGERYLSIGLGFLAAAFLVGLMAFPREAILILTILFFSAWPSRERCS